MYSYRHSSRPRQPSDCLNIVCSWSQYKSTFERSERKIAVFFSCRNTQLACMCSELLIIHEYFIQGVRVKVVRILVFINLPAQHHSNANVYLARDLCDREGIVSLLYEHYFWRLSFIPLLCCFSVKSGPKVRLVTMWNTAEKSPLPPFFPLFSLWRLLQASFAFSSSSLVS